MFSYLLVIALVAAASAEPIRTNKPFPSGRIVGGEDAVIETYPYQVSLQFFGTHLCGASIISKNYVLTAGHCIISSAKAFSVRVGSSILNRGGRIHSVVKTIIHSSYETNSVGIPVNDVALVKLGEPIVFDDAAQPINLYESGEEATPGVKSVITGWGTTGEGGSPSYLLQTVSIPIISKELCNKAYSGLKFGGLPEGQICAAYYGTGGKDACQGDSGGPLAIDGRLAGIVSWGNGCAKPYYPGAYTEIAHYREWINKHAQLD